MTESPRDLLSRLVIRAERSGDEPSISRVHRAAFPTRLEARIVERVRDLGGPIVSVVAELDGVTIGHCLLSPVRVSLPADGADRLMGLGPVAIVPVWQRRGIGSALVTASLDRAWALGVRAVFVLGEPEFYRRFHFEPAARHGLWFESESLAPYFHVRESIPGSLNGNTGRVVYTAPFDEARPEEG